MTERKPFKPTLVTGPIDLASVLYLRREGFAMTAEEVDDLAGFHERYTGKLERPEEAWGRGSLTVTPPSPSYPAGSVKMSPMGAVWLQTLGLRLVVVSAEDAERIGAQPTPVAPSPEERYHRGQAIRGRKASAAK